MVTSFYIQVILPLALRGVFTYKVSGGLMDEMVPGKRVVVPFGSKRYYAGVVYKVDVQPKQGQKLKDVSYVIDSEPIITEFQIQFWEWISGYYMCGLGSIMLAALPGSMRLSSQTTVLPIDTQVGVDELSSLDQMLLANLDTDKPTTLRNLEALDRKSSVQKSIHHLLQKGLISLDEQLVKEKSPKTQEIIVLSEEYENDSKLSDLLNGLANAPKQLEIVMTYIGMSGFFDGGRQRVKLKPLLNKSSATRSIVNSLVNKGVFEIIKEVEEFNATAHVISDIKLTQRQSEVCDEIINLWRTKQSVLLHGVTGSGKTLIYARLIKDVIETGQVLFLVPEIALTSQLVSRLEALLGFEVMVYHSRISNRDRLTKWMQMLSEKKPTVIVGARSSVFLPFGNLKLVVVDEEHEMSYKQHESSPHYNARDAAIWLASRMGAKVLMGSATPSFQTYHLTENGKYGRVDLEERYGSIKLPVLENVDMVKAKKEKTMNADFAETTFKLIKKALEEKQQVIIFQNRRGFAPYQVCESCGWSAECTNCDVNLTYHKFFHKLMCHYCGYNIKPLVKCPDCGSAKIKVKGFGTEKIEDDLDILLPEARIARMDLDTTRKRESLQNLIQAFSEGAYDILVGTQMVTKGLDFDNVGLVVVMNADSLWSRPDFRAFEKAFQILTQVAGRAGRKTQRGKVVFQTFKPNHPVLEHVKDGSYKSLYEQHMIDRNNYNYPPFSRMIKVQISHQDARLTKDAAEYLGQVLKPVFGKNLLGPEEPEIARVRNRYHRQLFIKIDPKNSLQKSKDAIWDGVDAIEGHESFRRVKVAIDVDPL